MEAQNQKVLRKLLADRGFCSANTYGWNSYSGRDNTIGFKIAGAMVIGGARKARFSVHGLPNHVCWNSICVHPSTYMDGNPLVWKLLRAFNIRFCGGGGEAYNQACVIEKDDHELMKHILAYIGAMCEEWNTYEFKRLNHGSFPFIKEVPQIEDLPHYNPNWKEPEVYW